MLINNEEFYQYLSKIDFCIEKIQKYGITKKNIKRLRLLKNPKIISELDLQTIFSDLYFVSIISDFKNNILCILKQYRLEIEYKYERYKKNQELPYLFRDTTSKKKHDKKAKHKETLIWLHEEGYESGGKKQGN